MKQAAVSYGVMDTLSGILMVWESDPWIVIRGQ